MSNKEKTCHITSIGGQAVIEGVMMRGPKEIATAVRKSATVVRGGHRRGCQPDRGGHP